MSRFGDRAPGCECTASFTCGTCLRAAKPYFFTPDAKPTTHLKCGACGAVYHPGPPSQCRCKAGRS